MAAPTLAELFGANATNDGTTLTIALADFASVGLDSGATYTPVQLAAALTKQWNASTSTKTDDATCGLVVENPFVSLATRGNSLQRSYQYACSFYIADAGAELDPDTVV